MNIISKVTWESMKKNRTRTIVTVIGIILSAAMFTAVTTLLVSTYAMGKDFVIYSEGNYHLAAESVNAEKLAALQEDSDIDRMFAARILGYAAVEVDNPDKPYLYVIAADKDFCENMPVHLLSGDYPKTENEILLPEHYFNFGGKTVQPGEKITLSIGARSSSGVPLNQSNPYLEDEESISGAAEKTFTVSGTYARPAFEDYSAPGYTAITGVPATASGEAYDVYLLLKNPRKSLENCRTTLSDYGLKENWSLLAFSGTAKQSEVSRVIIGMGVIFILIIFTGSVSLVYSAFSISVSERTRQFGLLSSIGATAKQIRRSVITEALLLCAFGIPLGILSGVAGIGVTLHFCGKFIGTWLGIPFGLTLKVSPLALLAAGVIALITVLVSAWIPSKRATKITAVEAIRQNKDIKTQKRRREKKYSRLFRKAFGYEGVLADKYFSRSRRKYRNTILALAMSVLLFVSAGSFTDKLIQSAVGISDVAEYDVSATFSVGDRKKLAAVEQRLRQTAEFEEFSLIYEQSSYIRMDENAVTESYKEYLEKLYGGKIVFPTASIRVETLYVDDAYFNRLAGKKSDAFYDNEKITALLLNHYTSEVSVFDETTQKNSMQKMSYDVFLMDDSQTIPAAFDPPAVSNSYCYGMYQDGATASDGTFSWYFLQKDQPYQGEDEYGRPLQMQTVPVEFIPIKIGGILSETPLGYQNCNSILLVRPLSMLTGENKTMFNLYIKAKDHQLAEEKLKTALAELGVSDADIQNATEHMEMERSLINVIRVFSYGFIVLISMIAAANVFNTISTNIALRRRDYAMLRSIGVSGKSLSRMMNYECLRYGFSALLLGLPLSVLASVGINAVAYHDGLSEYTLPWQYMLIAAVAVFVVVFISILYAMRKIKKDDLIEALKNENT